MVSFYHFASLPNTANVYKKLHLLIELTHALKSYFTAVLYQWLLPAPRVVHHYGFFKKFSIQMGIYLGS